MNKRPGMKRTAIYLSAEDLEKIGMIEDSLGFKLSRSAVIRAGLQALLEKSEYANIQKAAAMII